MKPKGMHDIPTAQSLISRSIPATRAQMVARLARMEHEKERLERELNVWVGKQQQTERRLQQVQQHIKLLRRALGESSANEDREDSGIQRMTNDRGKAEGWREIPLEY
ncbi:MAG: hypothetical protein KKC18_05225 [Chloroflexi bacterium]|nr:hypothetical protein [Chloroflexota bacterium]